MRTIGDRIKEVRESLGWTQEKLAEESKLSKSFISDIENNKRDISSKNILKISNAIGASLEYLMAGKVSKQRENKEPVVIPPELSKAAEDLKITYSETLTLLETHNSIVARRSKESLKTPTVEEWKHLYETINKVYPLDVSQAQR